MNRHLSLEDRGALDLLLDGAAQAHQRGIISAAAPLSSSPRIAGAQTWLSLLSAFPVAEPPADLVARTLRYISRATSETTSLPMPIHASDQPRLS